MASEQVDEHVGEQDVQDVQDSQDSQDLQGEVGESDEIDFEFRPIRYYIDEARLSISTTEAKGLGELISRRLEREFPYGLDRYKIKVERGEQTFWVWTYHPQYAQYIIESIESWNRGKAQAHVEGELDENCTLVSVGYYFHMRGITPTKHDIEKVHRWIKDRDFSRTLGSKFMQSAELTIDGEQIFTYNIDPSHPIARYIDDVIKILYPLLA
jgi:hypothetical protein